MKTSEREINALTEAMCELDIKIGYIVTFDFNKEITLGDKKILCISYFNFIKTIIN